MILLYRLLCDLLWQVKELSIILNIVVFLFVLIKSTNKTLSIRQRKSGFIFTLFMLLLTISYFNSISDVSSKIYFKILGSFLVFFVGFFDKTYLKSLKYLTVLSYAVILLNLLFVIVGFGFKYWGETKTFSGLFYFKTDLALNICTCLVFILIDSGSKPFTKLIFTLISFYMIYMANSRAFYIIILILGGIYMFRNLLFKKPIQYVFLFIPALLICSTIIISFFSTYISHDYLKLDISGGKQTYSTENLSGRNFIWEILINKYMSSSISEQLFGLGIDADLKIVTSVSKEIAYDSHNSFLFILISTGILGFITFLYFLISIVKQFLHVSKNYFNSYTEANLLFLFLAHLIIFLGSSISGSTITYQQETWFFLYYSGMIFQFKNSLISNSKTINDTK